MICSSESQTSLFSFSTNLLACLIVVAKPNLSNRAYRKGLNNSNTYVPNTKIGKQLLSFKAKKLFNFHPKTSLYEGLRKTYNWYKIFYKNKNYSLAQENFAHPKYLIELGEYNKAEKLA